MKPAGPYFQSLFYYLLFLLIISLIFLTGSGFAGAEKTGVTLSIVMTPEKPVFDDSITITGVLKTVDGKPLGNKRVTLEYSRTGVDLQENYEVLETRVTNRDGSYSFFRSHITEPESLRVIFAGNDNYAPATSNAVAILESDTEISQAKANLTGSVIVNTRPSGAKVSVDDIERGITPITVAKLTEGNHTLTVSLKGYAAQTMEVYATPRVDNSVDIALK